MEGRAAWRIGCIFGNKYNLNELAVNWKWAIPRLPDPGVTDLLPFLSLPLPFSFLTSFLFTPLLFVSTASLSLAIPFLFLAFISLVLFSRRSRLPSLHFCFRFLPAIFAYFHLLPRNVDLNDIFGGKFRGNRGKHSTLSGFLLLLSLFHSKLELRAFPILYGRVLRKQL